MKQAVAAVVEQIEGGDFDKAKAIYAGEGADLDLLKAYIDSVVAVKTMRTAMKSKFGDQFKEDPEGLDTTVARMAVRDFNTVIFLDDPNRASSSANNALGVGIEFKRIDGKWEVLSLASAPDTPEQHLVRLQKYISTVNAITEKLNSGAYRNPDSAKSAAAEAEVQLQEVATESSPATEPAK